MIAPSYISVDHVVDGIYIGGWRATQIPDVLRGLGIFHVLKLDSEIPHFAADFMTFVNGVEDGEPLPPGTLQRGTDFAVDCVAKKNPVLIMCAAGISRSSTFVLSTLLRRNYTLFDAYTLLRKQHPIAQPHPALLRSLIEYHKLDLDVDDILRWRYETQ